MGFVKPTRLEIKFSFVLLCGVALCFAPNGIYILTCVLAHEFGHVFAAVISGCPIKSLRLSAVGIRMEKPIDTPSRELMTALAGPLFGLIPAAAALAASNRDMLFFSVALTAFNLLPVQPLDGYSALLRAAIALRAKRPVRLCRTIQDCCIYALIPLSAIVLVCAENPLPALYLCAVLTAKALSQNLAVRR